MSLYVHSLIDDLTGALEDHGIADAEVWVRLGDLYYELDASCRLLFADYDEGEAKLCFRLAESYTREELRVDTDRGPTVRFNATTSHTGGEHD